MSLPRTVAAHVALVASIGLSGLAHADSTVHVYAAASLTDAMNDLVETYEAAHPSVDIVPVYASSSTVARQIANGAPADIYFSANEQWMDWLGKQGVTLTERRDLLKNHLVVIAQKGSQIQSFTPDKDHRLDNYLGRNERVAVGDPDHVPAGIYAKQSLTSLDQWQALEPRLARASDVRAAMALVERGEAPLGIVYATDAKASDRVKTLGTFPDGSHPPITYPIAEIGSPDSTTEAFYQWLQGQDAAQVFADYGFGPAKLKP
ncbi:molybdate ABC transporter substrate-binding protein [Larsenimonas salina]|uniref:molybdate ABC transporter substrate-binding protein n=1 Tax=Larsenimonas salina TaxID=1295565 RepID=UPI002072AF35|nr:molybdate ABC transporter substrate-binding protein [Larsenimonas salina]MCM5705407.1 molybdate ABC transporter substrate-binding protein [Larsenimonas salina]